MQYYVMITAQINLYSFVFAAIHDVLLVTTSAKILWTNTFLCMTEDQKCYLYAKSTSHRARKLCTSYALLGMHLILVIWHKFMMLGRPDPYFSKGVGGARLSGHTHLQLLNRVILPKHSNTKVEYSAQAWLCLEPAHIWFTLERLQKSGGLQSLLVFLSMKSVLNLKQNNYIFISNFIHFHAWKGKIFMETVFHAIFHA